MPSSFLAPDLSEEFPRLAKPPIVEAAIYWQARPQALLESASLRIALGNEFHGYAPGETIRKFRMEAQVSSDPKESGVTQTDFWTGFRLKSVDKKHSIQFRRDGLVFSRTGGYEHWASFIAAAKDAWHTYLKLAQPVDVQRLSVRFINQIPAVAPENIGDFLVEPPVCPANLQLKEFVYQSTFSVPSLPCSARVIKVMQPSNPELQASSGLFLDIDAFTNGPVALEGPRLDETLSQLRWMKNKVFFTLMSAESLKLFGG